MAPPPFEAAPETAQWDRPITHEDYRKMLKGSPPRSMDDKTAIITDLPEDTKGNAVLHVYHGWGKAREVLRLEIVPGDPDNTEAQDWAKIAKISWAKDFPGGPITEKVAKQCVINTCKNMLRCNIARKDEDEDDYEDEAEDEDHGEGDGAEANKAHDKNKIGRTS